MWVLDAFPLNPTGKVDEGLPDPWRGGGCGGCTKFSDLGGHSLVATRFIFQAREALGMEITLQMLFVEAHGGGAGRSRRGWGRVRRRRESSAGAQPSSSWRGSTSSPGRRSSASWADWPRVEGEPVTETRAPVRGERRNLSR